MKYPYERFLRFLVSRKLDVNRTLARYGLPRAGDLWLAECRTDLRHNAPFALSRYIDAPDNVLLLREGILEWAEQEKILPLWAMQSEFGRQPSSELDIAFKVFWNQHSRAVTGMLLLSRATDAETIKIVHEQFGLTISTAALKLYKDIFWDIELVSRAIWAQFVTTLQDEERNYISFGLTSPTANDVRDLLGMDISSVDHRGILNQMIAKNFQQYKIAMEQPNPVAADAGYWAELTLKAISTAKHGGNFAPDEQKPKSTSDQFRGLFSVEPAQARHPTLADLAGEVGKPAEPVEAKDK